MTWNDWGIVASIIGASIGISALLQAWLLGRTAKSFHADIHAATQLTLQDMRKGFSDSQERLGAMLERMDQRADERHREALEIIAALKR